MDEPWKYHAKWKKLVTTCNGCLWLAGGSGSGGSVGKKWGVATNEYEISFGGDKNIWKVIVMVASLFHMFQIWFADYCFKATTILQQQEDGLVPYTTFQWLMD